MIEVGDALRIPTFLTASTPQRLMQLMLDNNLRKGTEHRYFDITYDGKNGLFGFTKFKL